MMLAGLPVPDPAVEGLAELVRTTGADDLADRLESAVADGVKLIAFTLDERALLLARSKIHSPSSPSCAPSCSRTISGGGEKGSSEADDARVAAA